MSLEGRIAIVTGAARGIGAATVKLFVERGATVVASDKDAEPLAAMASALPDVAFLASDEAAYITGMPHVVAGGMTAHWAPPMQVPVE